METPGIRSEDREVSATEGEEKSQDQLPLQAGAFERKGTPETAGEAGETAGSDRTS